MGAAPHYALTEYFFRIYHIKLLNRKAYFALHDLLLDKHSSLISCSLEEIETGKTADQSRILRIEALYDDFIDRVELKSALADLPESYENHYLFPKKSLEAKGSTMSEEKDSVILACNKIKIGKYGKEKHWKIDLDQTQYGFLLFLAAHTKGLKVQTKDGLRLHPFGWIETHEV